MIKEFVDRWDKNKEKIRKIFEEKDTYWNYKDIVKLVIENITTNDYGEFAPDPNRIHSINDGDYQGTLIFLIAEKGYQPDDYYYVKIYYGSCSGCDTLEAALDGRDKVNDLMSLSLHIVQGLKSLDDSIL